MTINKTRFITRLAEKCGATKLVAEEYVNLFLETLEDCLREAGEVKLYGFGKFKMRTVKERTGRNPQNGKEYKIPEHKKVVFRGSMSLVERIQEKS